MSVTIEYLRHLDELRHNSKIKVLDFVEGVCSERQYRRYLNGSNIVPQDKFELLCEKLGFTAIEFYHSYHRQEEEDMHRLLHIYNLIRTRKMDDARNELKALGKRTYATEMLRLLDQYCRIMYQFEMKEMSSFEAREQFVSLVSLETMKDKAVYTFIDVLILAQVSFIDAKREDTFALDILFQILEEPEKLYVSGSSRSILIPIYYQASRIYGMKNDLQKAMELSDTGIEFACRSHMMNSLAQLYYINALAQYKLGNTATAYVQAKRSLATAYAKQDMPTYEHLKGLLEQDFNIAFTMLEDDNFPPKKIN